MGNVSSKPEDGPALFIRDQNRLSISSLVITNPRKRSTLNIAQNAFPATKVSVTRTSGEAGPIEYIQDTESTNAGPNILLKLNGDDELILTFTFVMRQSQQLTQTSTTPNEATSATMDTTISGLTFVNSSTSRDVENLVTREFHADPNLHKNANVALVGDYSTSGSPSVTFEWTWKWKPPKMAEDKGGGWRNSCSFVEYDSRAHRLLTLASFSYYVSSPAVLTSQPTSPTPLFHLNSPPKIRVASAQSVDSRLMSDAEEQPPPRSPLLNAPDQGVATPSGQQKEAVRVDIAWPRPGEDVSVADDGPVFRATLKALEQKTGNMRTHMKKVLKRAEQAYTCQLEANEAFVAFMEALREASITSANAIQPALEHYFDKIAREIVHYERQNTNNLQKIIIEPINRLYQLDIKQAESKKRDFEEESKDYYAYVSRYLGQRQDSVKAKKLADSDSKYQSKRRTFELKRFDYSSFMQDLHGGRKEQEVLSHLTRYADTQTAGFLSTAKKIEALLPQLEALTSEVQEADKEFQYQRREREEKRRLLEKSNKPFLEPEQGSMASAIAINQNNNNNGHSSSISDSELGRADSTGSQLKVATSSGQSGMLASDLCKSPASINPPPTSISAQPSKFKGYRDLEERDQTQVVVTQRKEGLLWALNRPGGHVDPRNLNKQGWHKFWIVLDQGKLSEYSNWKQKLDLHMEPIDLRMASVREARNAERRFCFEVITPNFRRVYQATSEEDMNSWIVSINNALQSAVEGRAFVDRSGENSGSSDTSMKRDIGSALTGKTQSMSHGSQHTPTHSNNGIPFRRTTVGARPSPVRISSSGYDENPDQLLRSLRESDQGNCWCADCCSGAKVEWASINLGIIVCIECSGIHRSLGTHISKIRSLTLDIKSFTIDIVEMFLLIGNRVSNMVWEAAMDPSLKLTPQATREQRLKFITAKYVDGAFIQPISATLSRYGTPDETLLAAVKKNEIQEVLYALALRANPNVVDKMRGTHVIWLALAAADPATPSPTSSQASSETQVKSIPFPIAELLIQNGAEIPSTLPAFPLGHSARLYLEQKQSKNSSVTNDVVSSLPNNVSVANRVQKDRETRLQKRVSAGGRLAKSPIPER